VDIYDELMKTAQALRSVKVDGEYWALMHVAVQNIMKCAEAVKGAKNAIGNDPKS
jgi:hypothetical protein